jgi:hypothetical protein
MSIDSTGLITWPSPTVGTYNITVNVSDGKATTNQNYTLTIESAEPPSTLLVLSPTSGATVNDSVVTISGVITYSPGIAVIANGKEAQINDDGSFTIYDVPLQPGSNTIDVVLNTQAHDPVTQEITVTNAANPPISVNLSPAKGLVPVNTTLSILPQQGDSLGNYCLALGYSKDGGAIQDIFALEDAGKRIFTTDQASFSFTFPDAGIYTVYTQLQSRQSGQCGAALYTTTRTLIVTSPDQLGTTVVNVYKGMVNQLSQNQPDKAVKYFTASMQDIYSSFFAKLSGNLPQIAGQINNIANSVITENTAELIIVTDTANGKQLAPVYLLREGDGVWRINGM